MRRYGRFFAALVAILAVGVVILTILSVQRASDAGSACRFVTLVDSAPLYTQPDPQPAFFFRTLARGAAFDVFEIRGSVVGIEADPNAWVLLADGRLEGDCEPLQAPQE